MAVDGSLAVIMIFAGSIGWFGVSFQGRVCDGCEFVRIPILEDTAHVIQ